VVGELSFFDGHARSAKVWAIADSELYRFEFTAYQAFADEHPRKACDLLLALGSVVSARLRNAQLGRS
jgi:CRP-like cAMP-binding protein